MVLAKPTAAASKRRANSEAVVGTALASPDRRSALTRSAPRAALRADALRAAIGGPQTRRCIGRVDKPHSVRVEWGATQEGAAHEVAAWCE